MTLTSYFVTREDAVLEHGFRAMVWLPQKEQVLVSRGQHTLRVRGHTQPGVGLRACHQSCNVCQREGILGEMLNFPAPFVHTV